MLADRYATSSLRLERGSMGFFAPTPASTVEAVRHASESREGVISPAAVPDHI